jgi:SAM-dependent methyltransferase
MGESLWIGAMMHENSMREMRRLKGEYSPKIRVLDVGSLGVNGSYREIFPSDGYDYIGLDMVAGDNVDIVLEHPYDWQSIDTDSFDIVLCGQVFEHAEFFWVTMTQMVRTLRKGGMLYLIAPSNMVEHRYPVDCYRFYTDGALALARYSCLDIIHAHTSMYNDTEGDTVLVARKPYSGETRHPDMRTYKCVPADHVAVSSEVEVE